MARSAKTRTERAADPAAPATEGDVPRAGATDETPSDSGEPRAEAVAASPPDAADIPAPRVVAPAQATETVRLADRPAPVVVKRVGFVPLVLGGVVSAGLGFAAGWQGLVPPRGAAEAEAAFAAQTARIEELATALAALPAAPDLLPLQDQVAAMRGDLGPLADRVAALEARVGTLARAPAGDGTLSASAIAAWQQDIEALKTALAAQAEQIAATAALAAEQESGLSALREAMAAQETEVARMVDAAAVRLDAAQSAVAGIEEQATATATATLRRAVLANLQTALDDGRPFSTLLDELAATGVELPAGISGSAESGVATLAALTETFPEAARAALSAARAEGLADDGQSDLMAFLRRQLDVRSVEPREGDGPDAVLSRAEAALRDARLTDALAEVAALPEVVRAAMGDWIAAAEDRMATLSALQLLTETLPSPDTSN